MKKIRRFFEVLATCSLLIMIAIISYASCTYKGFVQLNASMNSITSSSYAGNTGYGILSNNTGSAGKAGMDLMLSRGGGWTTYATVIASPGEVKRTSTWGRSDVDYLFAVRVYSSPTVAIGNPGRIAIGSVYTDK